MKNVIIEIKKNDIRQNKLFWHSVKEALVEMYAPRKNKKNQEKKLKKRPVPQVRPSFHGYLGIFMEG